MAYNKEAQAKYEKKVERVVVKLFPTDEDIKTFLENTEEPTATLIKRLIRAEIAAKSQKSQGN